MICECSAELWEHNVWNNSYHITYEAFDPDTVIYEVRVMTIIEEEFNIIRQVRKKIAEAKDRDSVNTIYHQARIWNRFHHFLAGACSYERYTFLNRKFKNIRWEALSTQNNRRNRHE